MRLCSPRRGIRQDSCCSLKGSQTQPFPLCSWRRTSHPSGNWKTSLLQSTRGDKDWLGGSSITCWNTHASPTASRSSWKFASRTSPQELSTKNSDSKFPVAARPTIRPQRKTPSSTACPYNESILILRPAPLLGIEPFLGLCYLEPIIPVWRSAG